VEKVFFSIKKKGEAMSAKTPPVKPANGIRGLRCNRGKHDTACGRAFLWFSYGFEEDII
jgi:hypothetical protein